MNGVTDPRVALSVAASLLMSARDNSANNARDIRERQRQLARTIDTRADYAEGARDAFSFALSILAGAAGVPNAASLVADMLGESVATPAAWDELRARLFGTAVEAVSAAQRETPPRHEPAAALGVDPRQYWPDAHAEGE